MLPEHWLSEQLVWRILVNVACTILVRINNAPHARRSRDCSMFQVNVTFAMLVTSLIIVSCKFFPTVYTQSADTNISYGVLVTGILSSCHAYHNHIPPPKRALRVSAKAMSLRAPRDAHDEVDHRSASLVLWDRNLSKLGPRVKGFRTEVVVDTWLVPCECYWCLSWGQ